jgi:hypothetical protein
LIHVFSVRGIVSLISLEKTLEGKLWATYFLLAPSSHSVMGTPVHLLWVLRHMKLLCVADRWAGPPLSVRVVPVAGGSLLFSILGLPRTILCVVHEQPSLHLFDGISCRVSGIDSLIWPLHSLLRTETTVPLLASSSLLLENSC